MTAVGKILVFMNFLLTIPTIVMIALVFTTRTNWKTEFEKARNVALVAEAAYKTEKLAHETDLKSRDSQLSSLGKVNEALITERDIAKKKQGELEVQLNTERTEKSQANSSHNSLSSEVTSLKKERDSLTSEAQLQRSRVLEVQKDLNEQRLLAVTNRTEADTQTQRARRLLDRVEELEKNNTQLTNQVTALGGSSTIGSRSSLLNPPPIAAPRDVYGTVRAVATSGLTVINIGSDSGLAAGNKLYVYRVDPQNAKNSLYLGELVVSRTEPKQAVGQFYPKPFAKPDERLPKDNDIVSTSLGTR